MISAIDLAGVFAITIATTAGMRAMQTTAAHAASDADASATHTAADSANTHVTPRDVFVEANISFSFERDVPSRPTMPGVR